MTSKPVSLRDTLVGAMDPLSRVLDLVTVESIVSSRLEAGGTWALEFPGVRHVKFAAVHEGEAWLRSGDGDEVRVGPGDCVVLTTGRPYAVASAPGQAPVDGLPAFRATTDNVVRLGPAPRTVMTGGRIVLDVHTADLLLDVLPPLLLIDAAAEHAAPLRWALALFGHETAADRPGAAVMARGLTQVVFVEALRAALAAGDRAVGGWLAALGDARIGPVLHRMHDDPARRWTVPELAAVAHLSRSAFADRFRTLVGAPPLDYLLRLRMHEAGRTLHRTDATVSAVGGAAGYTSDAAFSTAFKRIMGVSPSVWRSLPAPDDAGDATDAAS